MDGGALGSVYLMMPHIHVFGIIRIYRMTHLIEVNSFTTQYTTNLHISKLNFQAATATQSAAAKR